MITPTLNDIGRRVRHNGFFGVVRDGVLKGFDMHLEYATVLFDGKQTSSGVTLNNLDWADGEDLSASPAANEPEEPSDTEDDDDAGLIAAGSIVGGIVSDLADSVATDSEDSAIEGGGGSFGGGGASGDY